MSGSAVEREILVWKYGFLAVLVWFIGYFLFVAPAALDARIQGEQQANRAFLGQSAAANAEARADRWFGQFVVSRGYLSSSLDASAPDAAPSGEAQQSKIGVGLARVLTPAKNWAGDRIRVFWGMVLQFLIRLSVSMLWWPFFVVALIPFIVDALVIRKVKSANFGLSSPHMYVAGRHLVFLSPLVYGLLLLAPVPMPAYVVPGLELLVCAALWGAIAHFAKRA